MAYNVPDGTNPDGTPFVYKPRSAQANAWVIGYEKEGALQKDDAARAATAGVTGADKIDYAAALANYESRPDAELFANRRAREYATTFTAQDFARRTIDIAGPVQSSTIGTTSVADGTGYYFDDQDAVPFQPSLSNGDRVVGSGVPAPDRSATGNPDRDAQDNTADLDDDNDTRPDTTDTADYNPNV